MTLNNLYWQHEVELKMNVILLKYQVSIPG